MKCKKCGYEIKETDKFCNNCGAKVVKSVYFCPKCKKEYENKLNFCNECGTKLKLKLDTTPCPLCGKEIPKNAVFCAYCHKDISPSGLNKIKSQISQNNSSQKLTESKALKTKIIICVSIIVAFILFLVILSVSCSKPKEEPSNKATIETAIEPTTENEIMTEQQTTAEPTTEAPTTVEPTTIKPTDITETMTQLFSDNEIAVYYSDTESASYFKDDEVYVHLFVENKTNQSITIQADTVILDGISYNKVICSDPVSANSRGMIELTVEDCSNTSPSTVGADLRCFNWDTDYRFDLNIISQSVK